MIIFDETPLIERKIPTRNGEALLTICRTSGAHYLYLNAAQAQVPALSKEFHGNVHRTEEITKGRVLFDFDDEGKLIGIEIY